MKKTQYANSKQKRAGVLYYCHTKKTLNKNGYKRQRRTLIKDAIQQKAIIIINMNIQQNRKIHELKVELKRQTNSNSWRL